MGMNLTYLILKISFFGVHFMIGTFLPPSPLYTPPLGAQQGDWILNSLLLDQIWKYQILGDAPVMATISKNIFMTPPPS